MNKQFAEFLVDHPELFKEKKYHSAFHTVLLFINESWEESALLFYQNVSKADLSIFDKDIPVFRTLLQSSYNKTFSDFIELSVTVRNSIFSPGLHHYTSFFYQNTKKLDEFMTRVGKEQLLESFIAVSLCLLTDEEATKKMFDLVIMFSLQK